METNRGADSPEESPADRLQDDRRENKHFFWPVDPVEWSPITKVQVHSVPATANDYQTGAGKPPSFMRGMRAPFLVGA